MILLKVSFKNLSSTRGPRFCGACSDPVTVKIDLLSRIQFHYNITFYHGEILILLEANFLVKNVPFRELSSVESSDPRLVYFTHVR